MNASYIPSHRLRALIVIVSLIASASLSAQVKFYATGEVPEGDYGSQARDAVWTPDGILLVGTVAIFSAGDSAFDNGDTPAMWSPSHGWVPLADAFPTTGDLLSVFARVISADGKVIGGSALGGSAGQDRTPALWTNDGTQLTLLGFFPGANVAPNVGVNNLSADGSVVYGFTAGINDVEAFRYTKAGGMLSIGFLNPGDTNNTPAAHSTSVDGHVLVGNSTGGSSLLEAYRYTYTGEGPTGGTMTAFPTLPGGTMTYALVMALDTRSTIGTSDSPDFPSGQLVRWNEDRPTEALGTPSPADPTFAFSVLAGVTEDGSVVVVSGGGTVAAGSGSYLLNSNGWFDIQSILEDAGADLNGWTLDGVVGMSTDGTLVYGNGTHNGTTEGWLAVFPAGFLGLVGDRDRPRHDHGPYGTGHGLRFHCER